MCYNTGTNHHIHDSSHRPCIISRPGRCKINTKRKDMKWYAVRSCRSFILPYPWNRSVDADRSLAPLTTRCAILHQWEGTKVKERIKRYCCPLGKKRIKKYDISIKTKFKDLRNKHKLQELFSKSISCFIYDQRGKNWQFWFLKFWIRCLEEGADEFFLKPVRLSDMNKLKPHILKSRCREHYHQEQHQQSDSNSDECSNPTNTSNRKRKAADNEEILPQANRSRHS